MTALNKSKYNPWIYSTGYFFFQNNGPWILNPWVKISFNYIS